MWNPENALRINCQLETERICAFIQQQTNELKRDGVVIGLSGGIDSALSSTLCLRALGKERVLGLILPEKESNQASAKYAARHAQKIELNTKTIDITSALESLGTYEKRDTVISSIYPEYNNNYKIKIVLPSDILSKDVLNFFTLKIMSSDGETDSYRLNNKQLRSIVSAANIKQRTRMLFLYYYAEANNLLVCGTTNKDELTLGFFVKYGDGGVDIEPIAHLYKTQVYQLSRHLGVTKEIIDREPSPDTFSFQVSDEEMYFRMPYAVLDQLLYAWENKIEISEICQALALTTEQVKRVFRDFTAKTSVAKYLRASPLMLE